MIKELKYNGHTAVPSDYENADGDLATAIGVVLEDGTLKPVLPPSEILELTADSSVMYIHETTSYRHYIVSNGGSIYWITSRGEALSSPNRIGYAYNVTNINAIGNTLLIFTSNAINYYLWKTNAYISLGDHLPNVEISFGLCGKPRLFSMNDDSKSTFNITFDGIGSGSLYETWTESNQTKITSQVMAKVNKFLADQTVNKGRFALPFFVRYALRLYDGSLICHSAPILMNPSTKAAPIVYWKRATGKSSYTDAECDIMIVSAGLDYKLMTDSDYDYLYLKNNWSDIVKSVDVFISKPIYTYDQNGNCKSFNDTDNFDTKFIGALDFDAYTSSSVKNDCILLPVTLDSTVMTTSSAAGKDSTFGKMYVEWKYSSLYALYFSSDRSYPSTTIALPEYSDDKNKESLKDISQFYFLTSLELGDLSTSERKDIVVDDEYLQSLVAREVMTDDYLTHDKLSADFSHAYNARLNLSGVKRALFRGFMSDSMFAYINSDPTSWSVSGRTLSISFPVFGYCTIDVSVYVKENGETYCVSSRGNANIGYFLSDTRYPTSADAQAGTNATLTKMSWGCYVFYPNANAFKMVISDYKGAYEIDLKAHDFLNGSYGVLDYELQRSSKATYPSVTQYENIIDMPNKIYTSEVSNPFYFPVLGINSVGTGKILGISSAAKALSEGQFGQFPLYAFTSEGVWALEVSSTGSYSAKQPITRDVCINTNSITQIDSAVLFATDRGIMLISGSQAQCITDSINAPDLFSVADLPKYDGLLSVYNSKAFDNEKLTVNDITFLPFLDFLSGCRMIYDYTHQHIIVYNPSVRYSYIYSLKTQAWGMILSDIVDNVNSYPEALAMSTRQKSDGTTVPILVDFTTPSTDSVTALVITRPFKFDEPNMFKTIDTIIQRGFFKSENIQQVLYGSNDLYNWHTVWSSADKYMRGFRGTPYKAFRLAIVCRLNKSENLFGCTVQLNPRRLNQPR